MRRTKYDAETSIQVIKPYFRDRILNSTGASSIDEISVIQSLWSGYGEIVRFRLNGDGLLRTHYIAKQIRFPVPDTDHPRGWNTEHSHRRKLKSYVVEACWYREWANRCSQSSRIPKLVWIEESSDSLFIVLEDLDAAGFAERRQPVPACVMELPHDLQSFDLHQSSQRYTYVSWVEIKACLSWLAYFHATFMRSIPDGLWQTGTYWHLSTRHDEWHAMESGELKNKALIIDQCLSQCRFQTLVHGDAKLANFCFDQSGHKVAAVDFQYVGGGCGMKDVAYFLGSCLPGYFCERYIAELLDSYFASLKVALTVHAPSVDFVALEKEWRTLFPVAWTDFYRFLTGWSPSHWKVNNYSKQLARGVLSSL